VKARQIAWRSTCLTNLRQIQNAVDQNMFDNPDPENVTLTEMQPYFSKGIIPACEAGGTYSLAVEGEDPVVECDFGFGHE
ncbi:MAG: hypothetical protein PF795_11290, partial [Kiritimatiellae bacterium]|jgi:hypothetical protein|nr:hypothetical protein [Kiritimatiellia bacterium]